MRKTPNFAVERDSQQAALRLPLTSTLCVPLESKLMSDDHQIKVVVASDVSDRDGIGVEIYIGDDLALEIFRDDTKKSREVTLYKKDVPLSVVEESIAIFKRKIPWEFIAYDQRNPD